MRACCRCCCCCSLLVFLNYPDWLYTNKTQPNKHGPRKQTQLAPLFASCQSLLVPYLYHSTPLWYRRQTSCLPALLCACSASPSSRLRCVATSRSCLHFAHLRAARWVDYLLPLCCSSSSPAIPSDNMCLLLDRRRSYICSVLI